MIDKDKIRRRLAELKRPYLQLNLSAGDPGAIAVTKLSGVPWWPQGVDRPSCIDGHLMAFIGQIRLDEVPGFQQPPTLLSFHYCEQCAHAGKMSWGWRDRHKQSRYRVSLFSDLDAMEVDGIGAVATSSVAARSIAYVGGDDAPSTEDIWDLFPETAVPGGAAGLCTLFHDDRSKLGGWPSWVQSPEVPEDEMGDKMQFVAQLNWRDCPGSAWATGYAYLFASSADDDQAAELVIGATSRRTIAHQSPRHDKWRHL